MLTTVALAANVTSIFMSIVVIAVLMYCKCLLNRALVVPINKYGNDKIISALLWFNVAILVNQILFVIFLKFNVNGFTNYMIMNLLKFFV